MSGGSFFFAGGGTGGHIYPAVAVAEKILKLSPGSRVHFFISGRDIDTQILSQTNFERTALPARGFSVRPDKLIGFCIGFFKSSRAVEKIISKAENAVVIGVGGFIAAPVCWKAHRLKVPVALINVDVVPGKAGRLIARWAEEIFVQFDRTAGYFSKAKGKVIIAGCPLREGFGNPQPQKVMEKLGLDREKKILLVTGASSGALSINETVCSLLGKLGGFADSWQIVHLTGRVHLETVKIEYRTARISAKVIAYFDDMADMLAAADLVIGRSGAVSVAEYAAAGCPAVCMPYPHHKDMHQYLNAGRLVEAGAAVIVDDVPDERDRAEWLWEELEPLLKDDAKTAEMQKACKAIAKTDAACEIAERLIMLAD